MKREFGLKRDNDVKQAQLMYWQRLRLARREFAEENGIDQLYIGNIDQFTDWMNKKYGIRLEFVDGNISGAYTVTDEKKMMMFLLKYPG
jgi:hypothetical protein